MIEKSDATRIDSSKERESMIDRSEIKVPIVQFFLVCSVSLVNIVNN